ncbi:MAG: YdjY domain-containing protein, partial [Limisphaerales bacterium]
MTRVAILIAVAAQLSFGFGGFAQQTATTNAPPLVEVSPGVYQIGLVQLDKSNKSVQFPAVLNMDHGLIEYLLVTTRGKTHESLLKTEAEPYHIHVAMLLLGAKGAAQSKELLNVPTGEYHVNTPGAATNRLAELLKGDSIRIELVWTNANGARTNAAEDWITDLQRGKAAARGTWNYNGSRVVDGIYMAQQQGSIVAV